MTRPDPAFPDPAFWAGKRAFVTGHNGFKGTWLVLALETLGAGIHGFALPEQPDRSSFSLVAAGRALAGETLGDIRDAAAVTAAIGAARPEIVIHLAAQAIVAEGFADPLGTFAINVMGTLHVLNAARACETVRAVIAVTSDKVYRNDGKGRPFREEDQLGGDDPYSASKAAAELAIAAWRNSHGRSGPAVCAVRAGNVIGGGDFSPYRIVPDIARALASGRELVVRNPAATRPFQHVGDVLRGYLRAAEQLVVAGDSMPSALNFGPRGRESSVAALIADWQAASARPLSWRHEPLPVLPESRHLALDSGLAGRVLGWQPDHDARTGIACTVAWYERWLDGLPLAETSRAEVRDWLGLARPA